MAEQVKLPLEDESNINILYKLKQGENFISFLSLWRLPHCLKYNFLYIYKVSIVTALFARLSVTFPYKMR